MSYTVKQDRITANPIRSKKVAEGIQILVDEMGISRLQISKKSKISAPNITALGNGYRIMSDVALDKLEPVVNAYLEVLEFSKKFEALK